MLSSQLVAVQSNYALLLGPFVSVDPNPEIGVVRQTNVGLRIL
jgi:hypothetical protein